MDYSTSQRDTTSRSRLSVLAKENTPLLKETYEFNLCTLVPNVEDAVAICPTIARETGTNHASFRYFLVGNIYAFYGPIGTSQVYSVEEWARGRSFTSICSDLIAVITVPKLGC